MAHMSIGSKSGSLAGGRERVSNRSRVPRSSILGRLFGVAVAALAVEPCFSRCAIRVGC